jgi:hypothetical protein
MSSCCSYVDVSSSKLIELAQACLDSVALREAAYSVRINDLVAMTLIKRKNRWYHFGLNKGYVPTQAEIIKERDSGVKVYEGVWCPYPPYRNRQTNLALECKKAVAYRLLAAAKMGESVRVSTDDIAEISS